MKHQTLIESTLQEGGRIIPHLSRTGILCGRLLDSFHNPVKNITKRTLKVLLNKNIIIKENGGFKYIKPENRPPAELVEFEVTNDNWLTKTVVLAQTHGKAKYEFATASTTKVDYLKIKVRYVNSKRSHTKGRERTDSTG